MKTLIRVIVIVIIIPCLLIIISDWCFNWSWQRRPLDWGKANEIIDLDSKGITILDSEGVTITDCNIDFNDLPDDKKYIKWKQAKGTKK